jgi:capsular polysaccharide biosynthesis protein
MAQFSEIVLHGRPIEAFAAVGLMGPGRRMEHRHSLAPARVHLPPLGTGRHFLQQWQLRELPDQDAWRHAAYDSYAPPLFLLHDAVVHSSAGIVAIGDQVITETLAHTSPDRHAYRTLAKGIALRVTPPKRLAGTHISLLAGGEGNYFHSLLLGLARIAAVPENYQAAAAGILVPKGAARQREVMALMDLMPSLQITEVAAGETLHVDSLLLPLSICGECAYHPCLVDFYRTISTSVPPPPQRLPRRLYIDRRGSRLRPLLNEDELVASLSRHGFVAVRPEILSVVDQVRLFRAADVIVAPHGAALANVGFCRPGTQIIELLMDAYCNWCFRNLAGLMQLRYDCVLGRARQPWRELDPAFHRTPWEISTNHVVAAVTQTAEHLAAA